MATGDFSPEQLNFVADILAITAGKATGWTSRFDDAVRIPDVIYEAADKLREMAK